MTIFDWREKLKEHNNSPYISSRVINKKLSFLVDYEANEWYRLIFIQLKLEQ